ncbi:hypothetical protein M3Y98_00197100 [Aphelenchoides besseyi]|nr:hypothetical protein M3Y98_00197100 [Aphelenchoides besseyi]
MNVLTDVYEKLVKIYSNKTLLVVDKLKELDDIFMTLSERTLSKLPTPKAFRKLPELVQEKIRSTYYNKTICFEDKLKILEGIMHSLSPEDISLIPLQTEVPGLIEFHTPIFMQFNGQGHLTNEEFDVLEKIITKKNIPEVSRAISVGRLLRDVYERNPVNFPIPLGDPDATDEVPEEIRQLGVHLMFSKNMFDEIEHFSKALNLMKDKNEKNRKYKTKKIFREVLDHNPTSSLGSFKQLGEFMRHFLSPQRLENL